MEKETWAEVPGFPLYQVSNRGRVRSLSRSYVRKDWRCGTEQIVFWKERILKGWVKSRNGRSKAVCVALRKEGKTYVYRVHRLVLLAFIGPAPERTQGCHEDGNPLKNELSNLRWDTAKNNQADSIRHGTNCPPPMHSGETHPNACLTNKQINQIRRTPIVRGTKANLAREYGVSATSIGRILAGKQRPDGHEPNNK